MDMERKLRFGMVGGGNGAFIGNVHRRGATMDEMAVLCAGCFTRNPEKNRAAAWAWDVTDPTRVYADFREMAEKESQREDGIDFVIIVTPTDTHYDIVKCFLEHNIHVVCDKPLCYTLEEGEELKKLADSRGLLVGLTYTYASYAIIRQAREMIEAGAIGPVINIIAEYPQDWVMLSALDSTGINGQWRMNPARAGGSACCSDIGTHLEALIHTMTGLKLERVLARLNHYKGSPLDHDVQILLEYENHIPGMLWASQIAAGYDCAVKIRVLGEQGSIEWNHTNPMEIRYARLNQPVQTLTANRIYSYDACTELCRLPAGHPEGFYEAFANVYKSFCKTLIAKMEGADAGDYRYPTLDDGLAGIRFVQACLESDHNGNTWVSLY